MFTTPEWAFVIVIYLIVVALVDMQTNHVPNWLTLPLMLALLVVRTWRGELLLLAMYWAVAFMLWWANISGGGDVKVLMVELGLWPSLAFVGVAGCTVAVVGTLVLLSRYRSLTAFFRTQSVAIARLLARQYPSRAELEFYGTPGTYLYEVAGVVFAVLVAFKMVKL